MSRLFGFRIAGARRSRATPAHQCGVLAWLCAFAIAFQCIVVQSHVHLASAQAEAAAIADTSAPAADQSKSRDQAPNDRSQNGCFICQQMAMAGSAVLPVTPTPVLIERELASQPPPVEFASTHSPVSHIWRSRAPPISLQS